MTKTQNNNLPAKVGDWATYGIGSDAYGVEVYAISPSGSQITTRDLTATRTDTNGFSESQTWDHECNPNGRERIFTRRKNGAYRLRGTNVGYLSFGHARSYRDPSF